MRGAARILVVGNTDDSEEDISAALQSNGFESYTGNISQSATEISGTRRPDVVILNLNSAEGKKNPNAFFQFARALKESDYASSMRVMIIGQDQNIDDETVPTEIDDLILGPTRPGQICHRLKSLVRLNTMHEELIRRLNTSAKYGVDAPATVMPPRNIENVNVLYLGDAMDYAGVEEALSKHATITGALSPSTALDYLARSKFDSIIINAENDPHQALDFTRALRRNSRFFNLPVLMLYDADALRSPEEAYDAGVTDTLLKPATSDEIRVRTIALIREQLFRDSLRHIYTQAKHFATNDALTGLYARGYLFEHLTQIIADTKKGSQTFALAVFDVCSIGSVNNLLGHASGDRLIRQVGEVIGLLVRGEDLSARYSGKKFAVILPDTTTEQAKAAVHRICGVMRHTEFVIPEHHEPVKVDLNSNIVGYEPDDTAETLIDRAWSY